MEQPQLFPTRPDGPVGAQPHDAISFHVQWDWESETSNYWLSHWVTDGVTGEKIVDGSNRFKWKEGDAVGDCGLAVRWLREARRYLAAPVTEARRVG